LGFARGGALFIDSQWRKLRYFGVIAMMLSTASLLSGCSDFRVALPSGSASSSSVGATSVDRFSKAQSVLQTSCVSCHSSGGSAAFAPLNFTSEAQFVSSGMIVPGSLDSSKLIFRTTHFDGTNAAARNMPTSGSFSVSDYQALTNWVSLFGVPDPQAPVIAAKFTCQPGAAPSASKLKRLLKIEVINTLTDLLAPLGAADRQAAMTSLTDKLVALPEDQGLPFNRFDNTISPDHIAAQYQLGSAVGALVISTNARATAIGGACFANASPTAACIKSFITNFGLLALRRPLSAAEIQTFTDYYATRGSTGREDLIALFLTSPEFLFHLENQGTALAGSPNLYRLTGYEIASRLSYHFWQSMPNSELMAAAAAGELSTSAGIQKVLDTVIFGTQKARTKVVVSQYFNEWLKIDNVPDLKNTDPAFLAFTAGENLNSPGHNHRTDMITEANDLIDYTVWTKQGSLSDLLTSDISFAKTDDLAKIYGVAKYTPGGPFVHFTPGQRSGLLTRAAFLVTGQVETNPIMHGVNLSANLLCNPLPSPPADVVLMRGATLPGFHTTRDRVETITSSTACNSCHSIINPIGFAFENFDAFGRIRNPKVQNLYDVDGTVLATLPVSSASTVQTSPGTLVPVTDGTDFSQKVADSGMGAACMTRKYFEFTSRAIESDAADGCALQNVYSKLQAPGGGILEMFKSIAVQPGFMIRNSGQ
jgi:hypothetical protein